MGVNCMNCSSCAYYLYEERPVCGRGLSLVRCNHYQPKGDLSEWFEQYTIDRRFVPNDTKDQFPTFLTNVPGLIPIRLYVYLEDKPDYISRLYIYRIDDGFTKLGVYHDICNSIPLGRKLHRMDMTHYDFKHPNGFMVSYSRLYLELDLRPIHERV